MPIYEDGFLWVAWCHRCETQQEQWRSDDGDQFRFRCNCTALEVSGLTQSPNGPTSACVTYPGQVKGIRPSRRLLTVGPRGRLFREVWRSPEGVIIHSGDDYVVVPNAEGRQQFWANSFTQAFCVLTGRAWHAIDDET
jgi:hypothetical protein